MSTQQIANEILSFIHSKHNIVHVMGHPIMKFQTPFVFTFTHDKNVNGINIEKSWELKNKQQLIDVLNIIYGRIVNIDDITIEHIEENKIIYLLVGT